MASTGVISISSLNLNLRRQYISSCIKIAVLLETQNTYGMAIWSWIECSTLDQGVTCKNQNKPVIDKNS